MSTALVRVVRFAVCLGAGLAAAGVANAGRAAGHVVAEPPAIQASPISGQAQPVAPTVGTGLILGRVVSAGTTTAVPDAIVTLGGAALGSNATVFSNGVGGGQRRIETDGQGVFLFLALPKGTYQLSASAPGYIGGAYGQSHPPAAVGRVLDVPRNLDLADGEKLGDLTLPLWKQGGIGGTVLDEAGEPLVGISVSVMFRIATWGGALVASSNSASTDDRGMYHVDVTPGDYLVAVIATPTTVPAAAIDAYRQAQASGPAASRAYSDNLSAVGAPSPNILGLRVGNFVVGNGGRGGSSPPPAVTDDGRLFMYPTTYYPGSRTLTTATVITVGSGEQKNGIDLQLKPQPTFRVSGTVSGPGGPAPNMGVRLVVPDSTSLANLGIVGESLQTVTDGSGAFTFLGVVPGQYTLRALKTPIVARQTTSIVVPGGVVINNSGATVVSPDPILWAAQPVAVDAADLTDVAVALRTGARLKGRVDFAGSTQLPTAARMQTVSILVRALPGTIGALLTGSVTGRIDASNQFVTPQCAPGKYLVEVSGLPQGWVLKSVMVTGQDASSLPVDVGGGDLTDVVITLTDRISTMTGTVRGADGQPAPSATVVVFPTDVALWGQVGLSSRRQRTMPPGRDGTYTLAGLPSGDYYVVAASSAAGVDFSDHTVMTSLIGSATRLSLNDGDVKTQDLVVNVIK